jgi:ribonuclease J
MMFVEYETPETLDSIIIDAGIMFPENDMLGIDYIIPDFNYIMDRLDSIRGVIITHGHEDHTGAIAHLMEYVQAPVYATPLTRSLLEIKLKAAHLLDRVTLVTAQAGDNIKMGPFLVELFHVTHSIPDSVGVGVTTPVGLIVHTGDYKFDHTPVDGWPPDFAKLADFSRRGVLALLADSTNATTPGWTLSDSSVEGAFDDIFQKAQGRIIVATFASSISRIQQIADAAFRFRRKMAVQGYSMVENTKIAMELGYLNIPDSVLVDINDLKQLPNNRVVIMTTGSQGEPLAGLGRLAYGRHRHLQVEPGDTVVVSSHPIPGNEEMVYRTINKLFQRGADVIYDPIAPIHASGHAYQEEMKLMINMIRPKFFIPVHGELRHLHQHAKMAAEQGIPEENITVVENGTVITFTPDSMTVGERVPGGYVFVDGAGVGDIGPTVMRDREMLAQDGFVIANLTVARDTRQMIGRPEFISRGFVYLREAQELINGAELVIEDVLEADERTSVRDLRNDIEKQLDRYFYSETRRHPMVFVFVNEV